jgi:hypothetical protein
MSKFTLLSKTSTLVNKERTIKVEINKYVKVGTKRTFWAASCDGKRVSKTMFLKLYDCESDARNFIKWLANQKLND